MSYMRYSFASALVLFNCSTLFAEETASASLSVLGKEIKVTSELDVSTDELADLISDGSVDSSILIAMFGSETEIIRNSMEYVVSELDGLQFDNTFYVNGQAVTSGFAGSDGEYLYSLDIPATSVESETLEYSISILDISVDSGYSYEGSLSAGVSSEFLSDDFLDSEDDYEFSDDANLATAAVSSDIAASAYLEGSAKVWFIKGGVDGSVDLIDGETLASAGVTPATVDAPEIYYGGNVDLLVADISAYVGIGSFRFYSKDLYVSDGSCYSFGDGVCE